MVVKNCSIEAYLWIIRIKIGYCHPKFINICAFYGGQFLPFHCRFADSNSKRFAVCRRQIKNMAKHPV